MTRAEIVSFTLYLNGFFILEQKQRCQCIKQNRFTIVIIAITLLHLINCAQHKQNCKKKNVHIYRTYLFVFDLTVTIDTCLG